MTNHPRIPLRPTLIVAHYDFMSDALHHQPPAIPFLDMPKRMAIARESAGLQQKELAAILGKHPRTIINYENGHTEPRPKLLEDWARITNVPADWLMLGITPEARCPHCDQATPQPQQGRRGADTRSRCFSEDIQVGDSTPVTELEGKVFYPSFDAPRKPATPPVDGAEVFVFPQARI